MRLFVFIAVLHLSGCAAIFLDREVREVQIDMVGQPTRSAPVTRLAPVSMDEATAYAFGMSNAYNEAGRKSAYAQDATVGLLIVTAASTVIGSIDGASDSVLGRRAASGVAVQQVIQRGLSQADIQSLFIGARQTNCIATQATLFNGLLPDDNQGGQLTVMFVKDVEFRVRDGLVGEIPEFSALEKAFQDVITSQGGLASFRSAEQTSLDSYLMQLKKCLTIKDNDSSSEGEN